MKQDVFVRNFGIFEKGLHGIKALDHLVIS